MSERQHRRVPGARVHWILAGWIGVTALVALSRGIDLLWGVVILLGFAALAAAVLPRWQLTGLRVRRWQFPRTAVVGEQQRVGYEVETPWGLPRYGIEIHERLGGSDDYSLAAFVARSHGRQQLFFLWTPRLRGCWRLENLRLESRAPLGLTRARRTLTSEEHEIVVYPDFVPLRWLPVLGDAHGASELTQAPQRGGHGEFFALKPYRQGDDARDVHWRASARAGEMVTREYQRHEGRQLWIVLELAASVHRGSGLEGTCEQMIRIAHSVIVKAHSEGIPVGLLYRVADAIKHLPASADRSTYQHLRDALARVEAHAQLPVRGWLQRFGHQLPAGGTWLLFNLEGEQQRAALQRAARQRSAAPLLVEFDTSSFARCENTTTHPATLRTAGGIVSIVPYAADLSGLFRP